MSKPLVEIEGLKFRWPKQPQETLAIQSLRIGQLEHTFLQGSSGSGKTTLLNLLCGINLCSAGHLKVLGEDLGALTSQRRDQFRGSHLGVIFQQFNLLPFLSVKENIELPCHFSTHRSAKVTNINVEVLRLLDALDLPESILNQNVTELSAGQQQRVAACRAVIGSPELLIADEPTSALDVQNRDNFIKLLFQEAEQHGSTIIFVSHDPSLAKHFPKQVNLAEINQVGQS